MRKVFCLLQVFIKQSLFVLSFRQLLSKRCQRFVVFLLALVIFLVQLLKLVVDELLLSLEFVFTVEQILAVTLKIEHNTSVVVYEF